MALHYQLKDRKVLNDMGFGIEHLPEYRNTALEPLHTHDVVELGYVVHGAGSHVIGDRQVPNAPGSLGIVHYTQPHVITTGDGPMSVINLYLDLQRFALPDLGEELAGALYAILPMHPSLRHRRNQFVHLQFQPQAAQEQALWAMLAEQQGRRSGYREAMRSHLTSFLILCARAALELGERPLLAEVGESEAKVERLRRELDADPSRAVVLGELAQALGWSVPHLCRTFRRHTGMSIGAYLGRQRIHAAMVRLRTSSDSILAIALACGFGDPSYFSRAFRSAANCTPRAYRERFRSAA